MQPGWRSPRSWMALLLLVVAWFALPVVEGMLLRPPARRLHMHMIQGGTLALGPFAWEMAVRFALDLALLAAVLLLLGRPVLSFPLADRRVVGRLLLGAAIGLGVMIATILAIVALGAAKIAYSGQAGGMAVLHGVGWFAVDLLGAAGEEIYGRGAVLLVAAAMLGRRGATIVSGVVFLALHLSNPGADPIWLFRLFLQGVLLAYAVFRTGSLWWSVGYHTGWNWASAPLFGAAGSGYLDAGHIFDFEPTGSTIVTGGPIGPEGNLFAFAAVLLASVLLVLMTRSNMSSVCANGVSRRKPGHLR